MAAGSLLAASLSRLRFTLFFFSSSSCSLYSSDFTALEIFKHGSAPLPRDRRWFKARVPVPVKVYSQIVHFALIFEPLLPSLSKSFQAASIAADFGAFDI